MERPVLWMAMLLLLLGTLSVSCGGDDGGGEGNSAGSGSKDNGGGKVPCDDGVSCGTECCTTPEGLTAAPCCADAFNGVCGTMGGMATGGTCTALQEIDEDCPSTEAFGGALVFAGCCNDSNQCGVSNNVILAGMGCVENGAAQAQLDSLSSMFGGDGGVMVPPDAGFMVPEGGISLPKLPAPKSCD